MATGLVRFAGAFFLLLPGAPPVQSQVDLAPGPGRDLVSSVCGECHRLGQVTQFRLDEAGWRRKVSSMVGYGASYTDEEFELIVQYLSANLGPEQAAVSATLCGIVSGPTGALAGVEVKLLQGGRELQSTRSNESGEFQFTGVPPGRYQLQAFLLPYPPVVQEVELSEAARQDAPLAMVLSPIAESITVTAGRLPVSLSTATSAVKILSEQSLQNTPYQTLDDRLRTLPEFSLFRRAGSLVAHPTTQGVSLRGIGPSGVSRSLVLLDGVPLNDAFGGWVYWNRVPLSGIEQVEVAAGGQSSLYGNYGLGGVVQLLSRPTEVKALELKLAGGNRSSRTVGFLAARRLGPWSFSTSGSYFDFDGYPVVEESQRGNVDIPASSSHAATRFSIELSPTGMPLVWSLGGGFLNEDRGNGTPLTTNDTRSFDFSTGLDWSPGPWDRVEARAFFRRTIFNSNYSAVVADRSSERLTTQQTVPSVDGGLALQWFLTRGRSRVALGTDFWLVSGMSQDSTLSPANTITIIRQGGGKQATTGWFGQLNFAASSRVALAAGVRGDVWKNFDGRLSSFPPGGRQQTSNVAGVSKLVFSPSAGFTFEAASNLSLFGSAYRSFRAPTLNELYRGFRVGNILTNPNSGLEPEHAWGGEVGGRVRFGEELQADITWFMNRLEEPVSNVTLQVTPSQVTRERQNLGAARIYGMQGTLKWLASNVAVLQASYLWNRASVTEFSADPIQVGKRLPQVPEHRVSLSADVSLPRSFEIALVGRFVGEQFDDDLNSIVLDRFFQLDAHLSRWIGESTRVYVSMENITDAKILVARSPVDFIGTPFMIRGGVQLRWGGGR